MTQAESPQYQIVLHDKGQVLVVTSSDKMNLARQLVFALNNNVSNKLAKNVYTASLKNGFVARNYCKSGEKKQKLLKYPAFKLEDTITTFLKTVEPLLTNKEMESTKQMAEDFLCNEGKQLQECLEEVAKKEDNWLAQRWLKVGYLQGRDPVLLYSNPGMVFPMAKLKNTEEFIEYTAKVIVSMIKYKQQVDDNKIPVAKMGKHELDNSQFKVVFGTCRIPKSKEDQLQFNPDSKHIVVIYKNHFYKLPVYNKSCEMLHVCVIKKMLKQVMESEKYRGVPYGILTTDKRDNWALAHAELSKSNKNAASIKSIQESLFVVCLDSYVPFDKENELNIRGLQSLHGGSICQNGSNRWMDKTLQLFVNPNGMNGYCYEHSPAEGQPVAQMAEYISKILPKEEEFDKGSAEDYEDLEKLLFDEPSDKLKEYLKTAESNYTKLAENLQLEVTQFKDFGKNFMKEQKLSPDSFFQMALQYAFYRLHKVPAAHYETAHLRVFVNGRTEVIRSCSMESVAFAQGMLNEDMDDTERAKLLRQAVNAHRAYTTNALLGKGVDRHLLGLKLMAIENNLPIPKFYLSPGYVKSTHFRLSTSQVASKDNAFMCYAPLVDNGYSCCYNPRNNDIIFAVGAWKNNRETCAIKFTESLKEALNHMKSVLENSCSDNEDKPKSKL